MWHCCDLTGRVPQKEKLKKQKKKELKATYLTNSNQFQQLQMVHPYMK